MIPFLYKKRILFAAFLLIQAFIFTSAYAAPGGSTGGGLSPGGSTGGGLSPGGSTGGGDPFKLDNPLGVDSICALIALLLQAAVAIGIPIAVLFIVYAGFKFVMARGSPGELTEARNNLVATLIGIAIFVGASVIANIIVATLVKLGVDGVTSCTF